MLKIAFEYLTSSYSLLENPMYNYIIMTIVGILAYIVAYSIVGYLYDTDIIDGSMNGHILHWVIRFVVFVGMYYVVATVLRIYKWIRGIPTNVWFIVFALLAILCMAFMFVRRIRRPTMNSQ